MERGGHDVVNLTILFSCGCEGVAWAYCWAGWGAAAGWGGAAGWVEAAGWLSSEGWLGVA